MTYRAKMAAALRAEQSRCNESAEGWAYLWLLEEILRSEPPRDYLS